MMKDAESHQAEDKQRREEVETRNRADQAVYAAEKFLKDSGEKLEAVGPHGDRIGDATTSRRRSSRTTRTAINRTLDALMQAQQKAAENLYKNAGAAGGPGRAAGRSVARPASGNGPTDDVIDAEVVEEKK